MLDLGLALNIVSIVLVRNEETQGHTEKKMM